MMKYLEMNIKSKMFLTKQYALHLVTNGRKMKPNIDKYTKKQYQLSTRTMRHKYLISN